MVTGLKSKMFNVEKAYTSALWKRRVVYFVFNVEKI